MASRIEFFKSFAKPLEIAKEEVTPALVRPPYAKSESIFQSECPKCESKACVTSCDEKIIFIVEDGTPSLSFKQNGCTFCDECAIACEMDVLSLENQSTSDWLNAIFSISTQACVAHNGVICYSCKEPCIDDAILFNGLFNPVIDDEKCTGCGFCISRCPTGAISYKAYELKETKESE